LQRCLEPGRLKAIIDKKNGSADKLKGGNLHGVMNPSDENVSLFMFGGYD
jgi:hypothetical protein